jgi:CheY-like chemotaxis protein
VSLSHLLLVDDSEAVLAFEKAALSGYYQVSTAVNGRDALLKISQLKPAAVLLDLSMPEMNGDEVLARMRSDPQLSRIPVIIVSSEKDRAEACLAAGARAFLPKPIRAQDLLPLVERVLEERNRREELTAHVETAAAEEQRLRAAAEEAAQELAPKRGLVYLEDGEDAQLMAGAASVLLELMEQAPGLDSVVIQVGGGNLIAASLLAAQAQGWPGGMLGVQSTAAPGATLSWQEGGVRAVESRTVASGIATEKPGRLALVAMTTLLRSVALVDDEDLWRAVALLLQTTGLAVEPSGAAGVAALQRFGPEIEGERIGVLLTGGWIDERALANVAAQLVADAARRESV